MRVLVALSLSLVIGACVGAPPRVVPRPVATAMPVPLPAPRPAPVSADWRDWPATPGDWVYRSDARGTIALFGAPGADALLTLRCDRARGMLYLSRQGADAAPLTVRTTSLAQSVAMQPTGGTPAYVAAMLAPREPLLDQMAFSRGRFIIEQPGAMTLVVPAWAELGRVIEDCRR